jgi:hypothetical protein
MKLIKHSIILFFFTTGIALGQTQPPSVEIDGKDYYRHGYNSTGGGTVQQSPQEDRDSVTITSVMKYFVLPNPTVSPDYTVTDLLNFTDVKSVFQWSLANDPAVIGATDGSTTPIVTVLWNALGVDTLKALEVPDMGAACAGSGTKIPVTVIRKPEIAFEPRNSVYADSACYTQTQVTAGVPIIFDMDVVTDSWLVEVDYTVTRNGSALPSMTGTNVPVVGGEITLVFEDYGRYEITITKVTDNISRKSSVDGDITTVGEKFTYIVMPPVETGPIYRLPNNY